VRWWREARDRVEEPPAGAVEAASRLRHPLQCLRLPCVPCHLDVLPLTDSVCKIGSLNCAHKTTHCAVPVLCWGRTCGVVKCGGEHFHK
jgi:hypothetical protein